MQAVETGCHRPGFPQLVFWSPGTENGPQLENIPLELNRTVPVSVLLERGGEA